MYGRLSHRGSGEMTATREAMLAVKNSQKFYLLYFVYMRICAYMQIKTKTILDTETAILKVLGEPNRLRLAILLAVEGEVCVCRLAAAMDEPEYKVSRHVGVMRSAGLVEARREGTWMYYTLAESSCPLQAHLISFFARGFDNHPIIKADRKHLKLVGCGK